MRVGDKTNHNRLRIAIETDGTLSVAGFINSIEIMINQLKAIIDFKEPKKKSKLKKSPQKKMLLKDEKKGK